MTTTTESNPPESLINYGNPSCINNENGPISMDPIKPSAENNGNPQLDEILNSILPPRQWTDTSGSWIQYVTSTAASRQDAISLQEAMDAKLLSRQARDTGICPVRNDIYTQCYDELIRQVTINCPERGLLLLRVRDEIRMTLDAYKTLYDSSVTFGVRKQLEAEEGMAEMEENIENLTREKQEYENKVLELRNKLEVIEKRESERRALEEKKRKEEIDFLKYQGHHLDAFLKSTGITGLK